MLNRIIFVFQDTCTGFLLGGVGELDKHRRPNFLVVDASKLANCCHISVMFTTIQFG